MIQENQKYFNSLQILLDLITIYISFSVAYYIRFHLFDGYSFYSFSTYMLIISALVPVFLVSYSWFDLYTSRRIKSFSEECMSILSSNIIPILILTLFLFVGKDATKDFSRALIILFALLNVSFTIIYRGFIRYTLRRYRKKGYNLKHCIIVGTSNVATELIHKLKSNPLWGYNIKGCISTYFNTQDTFLGYDILGDVNDMDGILAHNKLDIVMIAIDESCSLKFDHSKL